MTFSHRSHLATTELEEYFQNDGTRLEILPRDCLPEMLIKHGVEQLTKFSFLVAQDEDFVTEGFLTFQYRALFCYTRKQYDTALELVETEFKKVEKTGVGWERKWNNFGVSVFPPIRILFHDNLLHLIGFMHLLDKYIFIEGPNQIIRQASISQFFLICYIQLQCLIQLGTTEPRQILDALRSLLAVSHKDRFDSIVLLFIRKQVTNYFKKDHYRQ